MASIHWPKTEPHPNFPTHKLTYASCFRKQQVYLGLEAIGCEEMR